MAEDIVRAFIAVLVPDAAAGNAERLITRMRPLALSPHWMNRSQLHITLKFLGEKPRSLINKVKETLADVKVEPFDIAMDDIGVFPNWFKPRILWIDGLHGTDELKALGRELDERLRKLGIAHDRREMSPHITLARINNTPVPKLQKFVESVSRESMKSLHIAWRCNGIALMQSKLTPRGAIYSRL